MSEKLMSKKLEEILRLSGEELKAKLPHALDDIRDYGISKLLEEAPDLLSKIIRKFLEIDAAKFLSDAPEVSDKFMNLLWEGVSLNADKFSEMKSALEMTAREIHVNIEASDSPFRGHFVVNQGKLSGGSQMFHFKDEDYRIMGPTEVLLQLLIGELPMGFSNLRLQTAGHSGFARFVSPVVKGISLIITGN